MSTQAPFAPLSPPKLTAKKAASLRQRGLLFSLPNTLQSMFCALVLPAPSLISLCCRSRLFLALPLDIHEPCQQTQIDGWLLAFVKKASAKRCLSIQERGRKQHWGRTGRLSFIPDLKHKVVCLRIVWSKFGGEGTGKSVLRLPPAYPCGADTSPGSRQP